MAYCAKFKLPLQGKFLFKHEELKCSHLLLAPYHIDPENLIKTRPQVFELSNLSR